MPSVAVLAERAVLGVGVRLRPLQYPDVPFGRNDLSSVAATKYQRIYCTSLKECISHCTPLRAAVFNTSTPPCILSRYTVKWLQRAFSLHFPLCVERRYTSLSPQTCNVSTAASRSSPLFSSLKRQKKRMIDQCLKNKTKKKLLLFCVKHKCLTKLL